MKYAGKKRWKKAITFDFWDFKKCEKTKKWSLKSIFWKNYIQFIKKLRNPEFDPVWPVVCFVLFFDVLFNRKK